MSRTRLLIVLAVLLAAGGVVVFWVHQRQVKRFARHFLQEALVAEQQQRFDAAVWRLVQSIEIAPHNVEPYERLAGLLRRLRRDQEADYWMERLVNSNPRSAAARVAHGRHKLMLALTDQATRDAARAIELASEDLAALSLSRDCAAVARRWDEARAKGQQVVAIDSRNPAAYRALAEIESRSGRHAEAIRVLQQGIAATGDDNSLLFAMGNLQLDEKQLLAARETIAAIGTTSQSAAYVGLLLARAAYIEESWGEAGRGFAEACGNFAASPGTLKQIHLWLGNCYGHLEDSDGQIAAYRQAIAIDPSWVAPRVALASALWKTGRLDEALQAFDEAAGMPELPADFWIYRARAIIAATSRWLPSARDWSAADKALVQAEEAKAPWLSVSLLRAESLLAKDRPADAEKLLISVRDKDRKKLEAWIALAELARHQGRPQPAMEILAQAQRECADSVALRIARADCVTGPAADVRSQLRKLAEGMESFSQPGRLRLCEDLARRSAALGDLEQAKRLYGQVLENCPDDLLLQQHLFEIAEREEDVFGMKRAMETVERIGGRCPFWHLDQAVYLLLLASIGASQDDFYAQAQEHVAQVCALRPRWARGPLLAARIAERRGNSDRAIENYQKAIELGEVNPAAVERLMQLLYERQRYLDADTISRRLAQNEMISLELTRVICEVLVHSRQPNWAIEIARRVAARSKNPLDYVWLGQILNAAGRLAKNQDRTAESARELEEAEHALRQAVQLAESSPVAWVALVEFLARSGKTAGAARATTAAKQKIPPPQDALALAECYDAQGDTVEAGRYYAEALARSADDATVLGQAATFDIRCGNQAGAKSLLERIVSGQARGSRENIFWARRTLAAMFAAQGGTDNQRRALDFIERNLHDPPAALADLRAKATLYAAHPARLRREAAIPLLEELIRAEREPPADDELLLAELYAERGDPARGDKQIGRLAKLHAKEPRCLAAQVKALLRRSCYAEADSWLRRLEAMAPGEFSSVRLRAEILFGENNPDAAIRVLRDFADRGAAGSSDWQSRIELVVANLEDFGQRLSRQGQRSIASKCIVAAEDLARQSAQREQKQAIRLARFLGAHGRLTEALRIVETTWENSDPNLVAEALGAISDSGACDPHQLKRIESLVTAALHKYGRGVLPLRHVSASVQIEQQRYAGAEVGLRQWLEEDPEAVIPLNNLSFLLALEGKDLDEASRLIDRGLAVAGPLPALLDTRAAVHAAGKRYAEAIADLDAAIADTPSPIWYYHQAQLHWSMDHKPAAQKALRRAEELGLEPEILHPLDRQLRSALLRGI